MNPRTKRYFVVLGVISSLLLLSWAVPYTHGYWSFMDELVYKSLHYNWLTTDIQQKFWAVMNARITDNVSQALILILLTRYVFIGSSRLRRSVRAKQALFIVAATVISVIISKSAQSQISPYYNIKRDSPSLVYGHKVELSKVLPGLSNVKDSSRRSYPGDHAMTLVLFGLFFLYFMKNPVLKYVPLVIVLFFSLPRLVSGAHWLTDTVMGSLPIASLFFIVWIALASKLNLIEEPEVNQYG